MKFNTKILEETFETIKSVRYSKKFPRIDPIKSSKEAILTASFNKSIHWSYEKEVRILAQSSGYHSFLIEAIEQVVFGIKCNIPINFMMTIGNLGYKKIKFIKATQGRGDYDIHYNENCVFY